MLGTYNREDQPRHLVGPELVILNPSSVRIAVMTSENTRHRLQQSAFYSLGPFLAVGAVTLLTDRPDEALPHMLHDPKAPMGERVFKGLLEMYKAAPPEVEWFMLVDDDTFTFADSLLWRLNTLQPNVSGSSSGPAAKRLYVGNSNENNKGDRFEFAFGGAGALLNRALLRYLMEEKSHWSDCAEKHQHHPGDYAIYLCFKETVAPADPAFGYPFIQVRRALVKKRL